MIACCPIITMDTLAAPLYTRNFRKLVFFIHFCTDHRVYISILPIVCYRAPFAGSTKEPGGKRPKRDRVLRNTPKFAQVLGILL